MSVNRCIRLSSLIVAVFVYAGIGAEVPKEPKVEVADINRILKVDVYYEVLCPDSIQFIRNQLYTVMIEQDFLKYTDLNFIPYGKVSSWTNPFTKETKLYCEHGEQECELNALHACLVENNSIREQIKMINCLMGSTSSIDKCGTLLNIDIMHAKRCKAHRYTTEILRKYGVLTNAIDISFVPTVVIDEDFKRDEQFSIRHNFMGAFCKKYEEKFSTVLENC